ncbi:MAG TPA: redoxin domain-containing protein [Phycisphaerae bacterium]|nr:redoxin domain-containing protein [Phycisphaerae bacterium]
MTKRTKSTAKVMAVLAGGVLLVGTSLALAGPKDKTDKGKHHNQTAAPANAKIGEPAPNFTLKDSEGNEHRLSDYAGKVVVLTWFNSDCPFVKLHYEKQTTVVDLYNSYKSKNVAVLAINSTNPKNPSYGKDSAAKKNWKIDFPILVDSDGKVGRMYGAKTTPHCFVIDKNGILAYAGAMDNDPKNEKTGSAKENYVREAVDSLLAGKKVATTETKPYGCSVKY